MSSNSITEKDLILGLKNGDEACYKYLFDHYYNPLCVFVKKLSGNLPVSEDLVQEVLIKIWTKRDEIKIDRSLKSYLFRAVHNQFLLHIRDKKFQVVELDLLKWEVLIDESLADLSDRERTGVKLDKLNAAVESLPARCKTAFKLSRYDGLKYKDIAESMNISKKTVEHQISKALSILRKVQF